MKKKFKVGDRFKAKFKVGDRLKTRPRRRRRPVRIIAVSRDGYYDVEFLDGPPGDIMRRLTAKWLEEYWELDLNGLQRAIKKAKEFKAT